MLIDGFLVETKCLRAVIFTTTKSGLMEDSWQFTPYIIPIFLTACLAIFLAVYAWQRRTAQGAGIFIALMGAVAIWSVGYTLELASAGLASKIFWGKVQYLGITATPAAWLIFSLQYTNRDPWLTRRNILLLTVIPLITNFLIWTTEYHGLMWQEMVLDSSGPFPALALSYGGWFWVNWAHANICILLGTALLIHMLFHSPGLYRLQVALLLFMALAPWLGNVIYIFRLSPIPNFDWTPVAFTLSGLAMTWNMFHFRLLDIVPVARRTVVESMSDGVIVLDIQGRIVDINPAAQEVIEFKAADVIGRLGWELFSQWPYLVERYGDKLDVQTEIDLGEGYSPRYFDLRISPIHDKRHRVTGRLVVFRDITTHKEIEIALALARDKALEASRLKTELLAKVSHELRTPLGVILGYTELLQDGSFGPVSNLQQQAADNIINSAEYLRKLVDELLDQAQFEAGKILLDIEAFHLSDLVGQVEKKMQVLAANKGLSLTLTIAPEMPAILSGDMKRLQQILVNLISNAIKFTDSGSVEAHIYCASSTYWAIKVSDTGPGIPDEAQTYIFEPFRQVDGSLTRKFGGTGLGLSIVNQLITQMGGQITLQSELEQGSIFTVLLPFITAEENVL